MNTITKRSVALGVLALSMAAPAVAQNLRPEKTFYILPRIGLSNYYGDLDAKPFDFNDYKVKGKFPFSAALELGYQFTPGVALGLSYQIADYPTVFGGNYANADREYTRRHEAFATLRFTAGARTSTVAPFLELGFGTVAGTSKPTDHSGANPKELIGYGPRLGLGLDIAVSRRTSFFVGAYTHYTLNDDAADGSDQLSNPVYGRGYVLDKNTFLSDGDFLTHVGIGLKINFKSAFSPVDVIAIDGPAALQTGQTGNYSATANDGMATMPVVYTWDFGDGSTAEGLSAAHAYSAPGTYNVTFTASNSGSTDSATMTTTVTNPPVPAEILSNTATPATQCVNQAVRFAASGRGDAPVSYTWNFGDGSTGTGMTSTHTYTRPGTYTVTVTGSNASGSNSRTTTVTINDCTPQPPAVDNCAMTISELNSAYFERNSSTITEQGRMRLMENVDAMRRCMPLRANIVGYASRGEVNPQALSEARARSVMQFYVDNGIAASRLSTEGRGMMGGSKKDDVNQYRRVDTLPVR